MDKKKMKGDKCNFLLLFSSFIVHIVYKAFYFVDNTYALKSLLFLYIFKNDFLMQVALKGTYLFGMMPPLFYVIFAYHYPYKFWNYTQFLINIVFITPIILGILFLWGILNLQEAFIQNGVLQQIVHFNSFLIFSIYFFGYILWGLIILIIIFYTFFVSKMCVYFLQFDKKIANMYSVSGINSVNDEINIESYMFKLGTAQQVIGKSLDN